MHYRILPRSLRPGNLRAWQAVITAVLLCVAALTAWAFVLHGEARRQAEREAGRSAAVVALSVAREHERLVDAARQLLLALSQRPEVRSGNAAACSVVLAGVADAVPGYLDLVAVKPGGDLCAARGTTRLPASVDPADVRQTAESGVPTLGRYVFDRASARPAVALSAAAIDDAGAVRAVVVGVLDIGQLERAVLESPLPAGASMLLVDAGGVILSHHPEPLRWAGEMLDEPLRRRLAEQGTGLQSVTWLDGVPSLLLVEPLARDAGRAADATIVIALPARSVFRDTGRLFGLQLAGLGLLALGGLVCVALLTDRLIARPAQGLLRVIRSLNTGDVRARLRRSDECRHLMGGLARSVNALGRRLEEHQQAAHHLEEQLRRERAARLLATIPRPDETPLPAVTVAVPAPATHHDGSPGVTAANGAMAPSTAEGTASGLESTTAAAIEALTDGPDQEYWGLREPPFENAPNPRFLWLSPTHSEALVRLTYALRQRRGCAVLTGEPGCGKTLLTRAVVQRLDPSRYEIGLLTNPHGGRIDLLRQVLYELGIETANTDRTELLHTLHDHIVGHARRGRETLVIVDDAQQADDPAWFEELSALLNVQTNERTLVTILLAGTPELIPLIRQVQHLDRRVSLRYTLAPLNEEQVAQYIRYRLAVAGGGGSIFTPEAITRIHEASRGVPRAINDLCDGALLLARLEHLSAVDEAVLRRVLGSAPTPA